MRRPTHNSIHRRAHWTPLEIVLIVLALLLISASTTVELYRWANPPSAPAAPRSQEGATTEPSATATAEVTTAEPTATDAPTEQPTATQEPTATTEPTATEPPATATTEPTATTAPPTITPTPTVFLVDPPLTMTQSVSAFSVKPGEQVTFTIVVGTSSVELRRVVVRNLLDQRLEIFAASSASGTCNLGEVAVCTVELTRSTPATITITARAAQGLEPGIILISQATAQDDQFTTAASNRVVVTVAGSAVLSSDSSTMPAATQRPATARPTDQPKVEATAEPQTEATATPSPEIVAAAELPAADLPAAPAPPALPLDDAVLRGTPVLPPTLMPDNPASVPTVAPAPVVPPAVSPVLPNTSATLPALGLGVGLFGFALALHGTRRVRRADAVLANEGAVFSQLSPLVDQTAESQQATINEIDRMRQDSEAMRIMLFSATRKQHD